MYTVNSTTEYQQSISQPCASENIYNAKNPSLYSDIKLKLEEVINSIFADVQPDIDKQINAKFLELDFGSVFDVDAEKIGVNDAIFFVNLLNQNNIVSYSIDNENISLNCNDKSIQATKSLLEMIKTSYDTNKPIRLDFDKDVTVILKLDKEGKVQAHFIPGSSAVEAYLKQNIPSLKQIFDEENINYSYLGYSNSKKDENSKKQKRSDK